MRCGYMPFANVAMAEDMAGRMAPLDVKEVKAGGSTPLASLRGGLENSVEAWAYLADGRPFAIAGIREPGLIWLLTSREIKQPEAKWYFARRAKADLAERIGRWGRLGNAVWAQNEPHIRLLEWLGFTFGDDIEHNGHVYKTFWKDA